MCSKYPTAFVLLVVCLLAPAQRADPNGHNSLVVLSARSSGESGLSVRPKISATGPGEFGLAQTKILLAESDNNPDEPIAGVEVSSYPRWEGGAYVLTQNVPLKAFPGAEGFGADTVGGRGGKVIEVTNLNDSGTGSLRRAVQRTTGPRTIVFRVGGTIELSRQIDISEANSYITIAGQTAPGDGIQLKNYGIQIYNGAHDIVIRHLRMRPGLDSGKNPDAITLHGNRPTHVYNVVLDHLSLEWAVDENAGQFGWVTDVTYQWCIFAEATTTSVAGRGGHGFGLLVSTDHTGSKVSASIHHSLFAHNRDRNPRVKSGMVDFRNNVVYNWGPPSVDFANQTQVNLVNNLYIKGPSSRSRENETIKVHNTAKVYVKGNWTPACLTGCVDDWDSIKVKIKDQALADSSEYKVVTPHPFPFITTHRTSEVREVVLAQAGATLPRRDAVDMRIIRDVVYRTGEIGIGSNYPDLKSGVPPDDTDHDGMPDNWELAYGLNPKNPKDRNGDLDSDGYTNLEEFLNELAALAAP